MTMDSRVRVLRTLSEIEEIRSAWESWPGNRDSEIDFYLTVLRCNRASVRPHVLLVERASRPDAILVGRVDRRRMDFTVGYLHLRPKAEILYFVYGAARGNCSDANCELLIREIQKCLSRNEADVAYLNFVRTDSFLYKLATTMPGFLCRDHVKESQPHFMAALPRDADDFYRSLAPKVRKNQKWQAKRLVSDFGGAVRIRCFREAEELANMVEAVEKVAKTSYQRALGVGFVADMQMKERLALKARRGWLRGYVLYLAERPCAYWIGDINQGTFGSDYLGYDPSFAKYSPGMYLIMKVIEGFCDGHEGGVSAIDFGPGHAQYKEVLSNQQWTESAVHLFSPSLKGLQLNLVRSVTAVVRQTAQKTLGHTGLLQRIKKTWRTYASNHQRPVMNTPSTSDLEQACDSK